MQHAFPYISINIHDHKVSHRHLAQLYIFQVKPRQSILLQFYKILTEILQPRLMCFLLVYFTNAGDLIIFVILRFILRITYHNL